MKNVSVDHAAQIIGVSSATIRNWVKAGQISPVSARPLSFSAESVLGLKNSIGSESFNRLKTRANKIGSANSFMPEEYAENKTLISAITNIVSLLKEKNLDIEYVMFLASLRLLEANNEIEKLEHEKFNLESYGSWARESVKLVIFEWHSTLDEKINEDYYDGLYRLIAPYEADDFLGLLYQSLFKEVINRSKALTIPRQS